MNQTRIYPLRVVLIGAQITCPRNADILSAPTSTLRRVTNQLPAYSAGDLHKQTELNERGQGCSRVARRMPALQLTKRVRAAHVSPSGLPKVAPALQKEYQCQES